MGAEAACRRNLVPFKLLEQLLLRDGQLPRLHRWQVGMVSGRVVGVIGPVGRRKAVVSVKLVYPGAELSAADVVVVKSGRTVIAALLDAFTYNGSRSPGETTVP